MSDGGYEIDEQIKKKRGMTTIRSPIFNKRKGILVSYPDIPISEEIPKFEGRNLISMSKKNNKDKISRDVISRCLKNSQEMQIQKSLIIDNIANKTLNHNEFSTKRPSIKKNASFSERLKEGWTKEQLMKHYSISEEEYEKIIVSIKNINKKN